MAHPRGFGGFAAHAGLALAVSATALLGTREAASDLVAPNGTVKPAKPPVPPPPPTPATSVPKPDAATAEAPDAGALPMDPKQIEKDLEDIKAKASRIARSKNQRTALRTRVDGILKGRPMDVGLKQELVRHARRIARLERARNIAKEQKDQTTVDRTGKLIDAENARHDKWLGDFDARQAKGAAK